jgi:hypothetical protein
MRPSRLHGVRLSPTRRMFWDFRKLWLYPSDLEISPVILYTAGQSQESLLKKWRMISDAEYRGLSFCTVEATSAGISFSGEVRVPPNSDNEKDIRKGFCAIKSLTPHPIDLRDHQGLEVVLTSDVPIACTLNMTCLSYFRDDLYQIELLLPPTSTTFYIPFPFFK